MKVAELGGEPQHIMSVITQKIKKTVMFFEKKKGLEAGNPQLSAMNI